MDSTTNPVSDTKMSSKQSVILEGVRNLDTRMNTFRRNAILVSVFMLMSILANFGTTIAGLVYMKDSYISKRTLVDVHDDPVATASAMQRHDTMTFPTYDDMVHHVASGMAIHNGTHVFKVDRAEIVDPDTIKLFDSAGQHVGSAAIETLPGRHLQGFDTPSGMVLTDFVPGTSRLCPDPAKGCYDMWKRECIPCSGEYRGIKQEKKGSD